MTKLDDAEEYLAKCFCFPRPKNAVIIRHKKLWYLFDAFIAFEAMHAVLPVSYQGRSRNIAICEAHQWLDTAPLGHRLCWCRTMRVDPNKPVRSQGEVSRQLGFDRSWLGHIESGRRQPTLKDLARLARYFDVTSDFLLGLTPPSSKRPST